MCGKNLLPPNVLQFHSVHAQPKFFTAYFSVPSLGLSLVLGVYCYMASFVQWLRLTLSKGLNRVGVSFPSPEHGNWSSFWNEFSSTVTPQFTNASDDVLCLELQICESSISWSDKLGVSASTVFIEEWSRGKYPSNTDWWEYQLLCSFCSLEFTVPSLVFQCFL
jgi:hypothetical protein